MICCDFETEGIDGNPLLAPPRPVGMAVTYPDMETHYYTGDEMERKAKKIWTSGAELIFHNAPFDLSVAHRWFDLPFPPWYLIHDTLYLVYLMDPHADELSLKPSAERYLDMPPDEQTDLKNWILEHVPKATKKNWGAYICHGPIEMVAKYAKGDTIRTRKLFDALIDKVPQVAYNRERALMPKLVGATRKGIRLNRSELNTTRDQCAESLARCEDMIRHTLGDENLNPHSGAELARALDANDKMSGWVLTPTGKKSTARDNLIAGINDLELLNLLTYCGAMQTVLGTFIDPWLEKSKYGNRLHPNWNQVRSTEAKRKGTRTGRMSSDDPNFQNIPTPFDFEVPDGLVAMPELRRFILPEEGHVWLKRDWSAQEMRILAHFEDGALCKAYNDNPTLDPHAMVKGIIKKKVGKDYSRKFVKECGFGMIYGMGAPGLSKKIGGDFTVSQAKELQELYKLALPGVGVVQEGTKLLGKSGKPITTWGGRKYYVEKPKIIKGSYRSFEYKLTNYLIQGSAADQTKQTIIDWWAKKPPDNEFMATVHDEINISAPDASWREGMEWLRECMNKDYFDVPMRSDAFMGTNWGSIDVV